MSIGYPSVTELAVDRLLCQLHMRDVGSQSSNPFPSFVKTATDPGDPFANQPVFNLKRDPKVVYDALLSRSSFLPLVAGLAGYLLTLNSEKSSANPLLIAALAALGTDLFRRQQAAASMGQPHSWPFAASEYLTALGLAPPINYRKALPAYAEVWARLKQEAEENAAKAAQSANPATSMLDVPVEIATIA